MRVFVTILAVMALAASPCAWDTDPREASSIAAIFTSPTPQAALRPPLRTPVASKTLATASLSIGVVKLSVEEYIPSKVTGHI